MNSPSHFRPILERLAYLVYLALLVGSIGALGLGWLIGFETGNFPALGSAFAGLALSGWLHVHGHAHWHFRECGDSLELRGEPGLMMRSAADEARVAEVAALLAQFEAETDIWARGELRRAIARHLAALPDLRGEFADALALHPDLQ